jgi:transketolase
MGGIVNGMAYHGGVIPYAGTFLVFSDYMRGALRLAALSELHCIWVFTHDSIGVGEDGPTHQPVEHIASLRTIPNLVTIRPGDANEVCYAWRAAIESDRPTALILSRQGIPTINRKKYASADNVMKGAYILKDLGGGKPDIILVASGTEVSLIISAGDILHEEGIKVRLVSFPSWELFEMQDGEYQESVFPTGITRRLSVEAGISQGWHKWVGHEGDIISVEKYGVSAPQGTVYEKFGLTVDNILARTKALLG